MTGAKTAHRRRSAAIGWPGSEPCKVVEWRAESGRLEQSGDSSSLFQPASTRVVRVETDQGEGFLKALRNPEGPHVLACELVGTLLADGMGIPTLDFSIIEVTDESWQVAEGRDRVRRSSREATRALHGAAIRRRSRRSRIRKTSQSWLSSILGFAIAIDTGQRQTLGRTETTCFSRGEVDLHRDSC